MLQTAMRGPLPDLLAIAGAAAVIASLAIVALGFSRDRALPNSPIDFFDYKNYLYSDSNLIA